MVVAVALFELHIEFAQSLKEKRMVVKSLKDKLRHRFEISAAEVGLQDVHPRARIGVTFIALDGAQADARLARIESSSPRTRTRRWWDRRARSSILMRAW